MPKDTLARGAKSASFGSLCHISQAKWDAMYAPEKLEPVQVLNKVDAKENTESTK